MKHGARRQGLSDLARTLAEGTAREGEGQQQTQQRGEKILNGLLIGSLLLRLLGLGRSKPRGRKASGKARRAGKADDWTQWTPWPHVNDPVYDRNGFPFTPPEDR